MTRKTNDSFKTQSRALVNAFLRPYEPIERLRTQVVHLLSRPDILQVVEEMTQGDRETLFGHLNEVYQGVDAQDKEFLTLFGTFCSATKQLPPSASLSAELSKSEDVAVAPAGITDLWRGQLRGACVAIKAFRAYPAQNLEEAEEILRKRAPTWRKLVHPNIVAFHGITTHIFRLALVYDWEENSIVDHIRLYPQEPRLPLLQQVAEGLRYLHSLDVLHGCLKGANVLVSSSGKVKLTDYGLAPLNANANLTVLSPTTGNARWLAPEIIDPHPSAVMVTESKPADVFGFGMLTVEVFSGQLPFAEHPDTGVAPLVSNGIRPERPQNAEDVGLTDQVWELIERCWHQRPTQRPTVDRVCEELLGDNRAPPPANTGGRRIRPGSQGVAKLRKWLCLA